MTQERKNRVDAIERPQMTLFGWLALGALLLSILILRHDQEARRNAVPPSIPVEYTPSFSTPTSVVVEAVPVDSAPAPAAGERGLVGMDAAAIRAALGAPDFVRRDGASQMWRYGSGACTLTLFLHGQDDSLAVEHVEGRGLRNLRDPGADCSERLIGERRRGDLPG